MRFLMFLFITLEFNSIKIVEVLKCLILVVTGNWGEQGDGFREFMTLDPEHGTLTASMEMTHGRI